MAWRTPTDAERSARVSMSRARALTSFVGVIDDDGRREVVA